MNKHPYLFIVLPLLALSLFIWLIVIVGDTKSGPEATHQVTEVAELVAPQTCQTVIAPAALQVGLLTLDISFGEIFTATAISTNEYGSKTFQYPKEQSNDAKSLESTIYARINTINEDIGNWLIAKDVNGPSVSFRWGHIYGGSDTSEQIDELMNGTYVGVNSSYNECWEFLQELAPKVTWNNNPGGEVSLSLSEVTNDRTYFLLQSAGGSKLTFYIPTEQFVFILYNEFVPVNGMSDKIAIAPNVLTMYMLDERAVASFEIVSGDVRGQNAIAAQLETLKYFYHDLSVYYTTTSDSSSTVGTVLSYTK